LKFVADEGVDRPIIDALRSAGHDVFYIAEASPGISDEEVLSISHSRQAVLLTMDKDFGALVFRQRSASHGVLLLRLAGLTALAKARAVVAVVDRHGSEMSGAFSVVTQNKIRIRRRS
jgi:predicted nuclease of predicted toxin-antitoxin system